MGTEPNGEVSFVTVDQVVVLIGSAPDLSFMDGVPGMSSGSSPISNPTTAYPGKRATHPVFLDVDPYSMQVFGAPPNLFAIGPLRGDNFVRFLVGDGWGITKQLVASTTPSSNHFVAA